MAWCHYLNQWWPSLLTHMSITRPQWVIGLMLPLQLPSRLFFKPICKISPLHGKIANRQQRVSRRLPLTAQHYNDVIMNVMSSLITSLTIVYSIVYSGADQRKHQSSASLAFVRGIHRWPVNSPHKGPENVSIWWRRHDFFIIYLCQIWWEPRSSCNCNQWSHWSHCSCHDCPRSTLPNPARSSPYSHCSQKNPDGRMQHFHEWNFLYFDSNFIEICS